MDPRAANACVYTLSQILKALKEHDIEERLAQLEQEYAALRAEALARRAHEQT
jgi:ribosomal protein L29